MQKKQQKGLTPKQILEDAKRQDRARQQYSTDLAEVEGALTAFMEQKDPIVWEGKAIAWVRRPTMRQLKELIPVEMRKYANNPENLPEELTEKYEGFFYEKMSEMIAIPKRSPKEWEETTNPWFIRIFWEHMAYITQMMEGEIEGF